MTMSFANLSGTVQLMVTLNYSLKCKFYSLGEHVEYIMKITFCFVFLFLFAGSSHSSEMYTSHHCSGACAYSLCTRDREDSVLYDKKRAD